MAQRLAALAQPRIAAPEFAMRFFQHFVLLDGAAIALGGECILNVIKLANRLVSSWQISEA